MHGRRQKTPVPQCRSAVVISQPSEMGAYYNDHYDDFVQNTSSGLQLYGRTAYIFYDDDDDDDDVPRNGSSALYPEEGIGVGAVFILIAFVAIFGSGMVGNCLVVRVILRSPSLRTVTNMYLISLAVANLFYLFFSVPIITTAYAMGTWPFGNFLCGFTGYVRDVTMAVSVLTLTATGIDRYLAILHPVQSRQYRSQQSAMIVIVAIWALSLSTMVHNFFMYQVRAMLGVRSVYLECSLTAGRPIRRLTATVALSLLLYVLPQTVLAVCYLKIARRLWTSRASDSSRRGVASARELRARRRVVCVVLFVTLAFGIGWLPVHVIALYHSCRPQDALYIYSGEILSLCFSFGVNAVNPLIYCLRSANFRQLFKETLACSRPRDTRPTSFEVRSRLPLRPRSDVIHMTSASDLKPLKVSSSESDTKVTSPSISAVTEPNVLAVGNEVGVAPVTLL